MFASMTLLLLLGNCAAIAQADPVGALCTVDPAGPLHNNLNLLQVDLSMRSDDSAPEGERHEYKKLGLKASADVNNEVLGLLSEDAKDVDQLLLRDESLLTAASLLDAADSILTAISAEKLAISTPPPPMVDQDPPQGTMIYVVVGVVLFLACCLLLLFPLAGKEVGKPRAMGDERWKMGDEESEDEEPMEVWERKLGKNKRNSMIALFEKLAEIQVSDESPPGFFTRSDLADAMACPQDKQEMVRLGLNVDDVDTAFPHLGRDSVGLVDMRAFTAALDNDSNDLGR